MNITRERWITLTTDELVEFIEQYNDVYPRESYQKPMVILENGDVVYEGAERMVLFNVNEPIKPYSRTYFLDDNEMIDEMNAGTLYGYSASLNIDKDGRIVF